MNDSEISVMRMLDNAINYHRGQGHVITGIIISTPLKNHLKNACCKAMNTIGAPEDLDINKFMGIPIIETSESENKCEVIWKNG